MNGVEEVTMVSNLGYIDDSNGSNDMESDDVSRQCLTWRMNPLDSHSDWTVEIEIRKDGKRIMSRSSTASTSKEKSRQDEDKCLSSRPPSRKRRSMDETMLFRRHCTLSRGNDCSSTAANNMGEEPEPGNGLERRSNTSSLLGQPVHHPRREDQIFKFHVHKTILGVGPYKSQYFEALFMHYSESHVQHIIPCEMSLRETHVCTSKLKFETFDMIEAFSVVLDYIYSHGIIKRFTTSNAVAVKYMASYLGVSSLQVAISEFILRQDLCRENCLTYLSKASSCHDEQIVIAAADMAAQHLEQLSRSDLLNITPDLFERIVSSTNLNCVSEELSCILAEYCRHVFRSTSNNGFTHYRHSQRTRHPEEHAADAFDSGLAAKRLSLSCGDLENHDTSLTDDEYTAEYYDEYRRKYLNEMTPEWFCSVTDVKIMPRIFPGEGLYLLHLSQKMFPFLMNGSRRRHTSGLQLVKNSFDSFRRGGYGSSSSSEDETCSYQRRLTDHYLSLKQRCIEAVSEYWSELLVKDGEDEEHKESNNRHSYETKTVPALLAWPCDNKSTGIKKRRSTSYMMEFDMMYDYDHPDSMNVHDDDDDDDDDDPNNHNDIQQKLLSKLSPYLQNKVLGAALKAARDELEETAAAQVQRLLAKQKRGGERHKLERRASAPDTFSSRTRSLATGQEDEGVRRWSDPMDDGAEEKSPNLLHPLGRGVGLGRAQQQQPFSVGDDQEQNNIHQDVETTKHNLSRLRRISLTRTDDACNVDEIQRELKNAASKILMLES